MEFVFFHNPAWASESGEAGGFKPKAGLVECYVKHIATHFKGRVHGYQLSHEAKNQGLMAGANVDFTINDILLKNAQTIRTDGGYQDTLIAENLTYKCMALGIILKLDNRVENNIVADVTAPSRGYYFVGNGNCPDRSAPRRFA